MDAIFEVLGYLFTGFDAGKGGRAFVRLVTLDRVQAEPNSTLARVTGALLLVAIAGAVVAVMAAAYTYLAPPLATPPPR